MARGTTSARRDKEPDDFHLNQKKGLEMLKRLYKYLSLLIDIQDIEYKMLVYWAVYFVILTDRL